MSARPVTAVIRTESLTKRYGRLTVVSGVGLAGPGGGVSAVPGPTGPGRPTTIGMLLGLVSPPAGHAELLGRPMPAGAQEALAEVGALIEGPGFYPNMSGRRNLTLFDAAGPGGSRATRSRRIADVLDRVGLGGIDRRPVKAYSMGMRQRLGLAAALLPPPRPLLLDGPTKGLDPQGIREMGTLLSELAGEGTTVFLSSHLLSEVETICTRAAMMAQGRLVAQDSIERLLAPTGRLLVDTPDADTAVAVLA